MPQSLAIRLDTSPLITPAGRRFAYLQDGPGKTRQYRRPVEQSKKDSPQGQYQQLEGQQEPTLPQTSLSLLKHELEEATAMIRRMQRPASYKTREQEVSLYTEPFC